MNVFIREMRGNLKSLIIWSIGMWLLVLIGMVKYSGIAAAGGASIELFKAMPESLKAIFGMSGVDVTSVGSFFSIFFLYFMLLSTIHSGMLGATIVSKEERDRTADYIFAKPRTRGGIISGKLFALLANILVINIVTCISSITTVAMYNKGESLNGKIITMMVALFILQILFAAIGLLASALTGTSKKAASVTTFVILVSYSLSIAINVNKNLDFLRLVTPFKYFEGVDIMDGKVMELNYILFSGIISIVMILAAYYFYKKKDIRV